MATCICHHADASNQKAKELKRDRQLTLIAMTTLWWLFMFKSMSAVWCRIVLNIFQIEQEAQLMLTTGSTRLAVNQGQQLCNSNFVFKTRGFYDIRLQKCRNLENRVRGPSSSLEMSPCDRAHTTFY